MLDVTFNPPDFSRDRGVSDMDAGKLLLLSTWNRTEDMSTRGFNKYCAVRCVLGCVLKQSIDQKKICLRLRNMEEQTEKLFRSYNYR